jgi:hypothetical protein
VLLVAETAVVVVVPVAGAVPIMVPIVSVPVDIVLIVSVMVVDEVSVVLVVAEVSVTLVFDSFLQAKPNRATAAMVRKTRSVFFILILSCCRLNC